MRILFYVYNADDYTTEDMIPEYIIITLVKNEVDRTWYDISNYK